MLSLVQSAEKIDFCLCLIPWHFFSKTTLTMTGGDDKSLPFQLLVCWSLMFTLVQSAEKIDFCLWQKFIFIITIGGGMIWPV